MIVARHILVVSLLLALLAGSARAQEPAPIARTHNPGLALAALGINMVYIPVRLGLTAAGAVLGGLTGFMTFGDRAAAQAVWGLTDGSMVITPEMLEGTEPWHFSAYD
jgi:hypothetical protein